MVTIDEAEEGSLSPSTPRQSFKTMLMVDDSDEKKNNSTLDKPFKVLLYGSFFGGFLAAADESVMISIYSTVASQFQRLSMGSWLVVSYNFGACVASPVFGALCDLYGLKCMVVISYCVFMIGSFACGVSMSLSQLVIARVSAGIGGEGIVALVSVLIADTLPPGDIALYRALYNMMTTTGRSLGAPIGGFLNELIGWRWLFLGQLPLAALCIVVFWHGRPSALDFIADKDHQTARRNPEQSSAGIKDVDFLGIISMSVAILLLLVFIQDVGGKDSSSGIVLTSIILGIVLASFGFVMIELRWARKPLIPLGLLRGALGKYSSMQLIILTARSAVLSQLALYFIRVENWSDGWAATAVTINALGTSSSSLASGFMLKRYPNHHKPINIVGISLILITYLLIAVFWRDGCSNWLETSFTFFEGMGLGILFPAQFAGLTASVPEGSLARYIGTYGLAQELGFVIGPAVSSAVVLGVFARGLRSSLKEEDGKVIDRILDEERFSQTLSDSIQQVVRSSYLYSFQFVPILGVLFCSVSMVIAFRA